MNPLAQLLRVLPRALPRALVVTAVLAVGCDDDAPGRLDREACEQWLKSYNQLSCVDQADRKVDAAAVCDQYDGAGEADCSAIFNCWADNLACEDGGTGGGAVNDFAEGCPTACE